MTKFEVSCFRFQMLFLSKFTILWTGDDDADCCIVIHKLLSQGFLYQQIVLQTTIDIIIIIMMMMMIIIIIIIISSKIKPKTASKVHFIKCCNKCNKGFMWFFPIRFAVCRRTFLHWEKFLPTTTTPFPKRKMLTSTQLMQHYLALNNISYCR